MTQVHQLNIKTIRLLCFCFICRISRSLCNLMLWFLEWYFVAVGLVKIILQSDGQNDTKSLCGHKANSFHCLNISFIQYINFQYLAGFHSVVYIVHLGKLMQISYWCTLTKVFNGKGWPSWSLTSKFLIEWNVTTHFSYFAFK